MPGSPRVWLLAARPKTLPAAAAPVVIGAGLAVSDGVFELLPVIAALFGALLIQIGTNLANDYYDFVRGTDTPDRVGPTRVTQAGLVSPEKVRGVMFGTLALAFVVGIYLVWVGGWPIAVVGLASLVCAVAYTGGPFPLGYHGLGDLFVFVFFGLVAVGGTYWVQALSLPVDALVAGAGVGCLSTAVLVVNNLRDLRTDTAAGKRTLAARMGAPATKLEYALLVLVGLAVPVVGWAWMGWPVTTLAASAVGLWAVSPLRTIMAHEEPSRLIPVLGQTARLVAVYGLLLGLGFAWG